MKKKTLIYLCVVFMAISLVGCNKEGKSENKTTEEVATEAITEATEVSNTEETTENQAADTDTADSAWIMGGSDRTGYVEVPQAWTLNEATTGNQYGIQYIEENYDGIVSLLENDYGFDPDHYDGEEPASYIINSYIAQYETMGAMNVSLETIDINGFEFYRSIDYIPAGGYVEDYDYYLYTYVTYTGDRFYTFIVEGSELVIADAVARAESTFNTDGVANAADSEDND